MLVGAGFIADGAVVRGGGVHFAWWLGPLEDNPVLGSTDGPTRLDLSTRGYAEYLRDFRALEWYRIPATTRQAHVTGPYVDHLCTCDYILTLTMPVHARDGERMVGVVGADIAVRHLEGALLRKFLDVESPVVLVNEQGRVVACPTDPSLQVAGWPARDRRTWPARVPRSRCASTPRHPVRNQRYSVISLTDERLHRGRRALACGAPEKEDSDELCRDQPRHRRDGQDVPDDHRRRARRRHRRRRRGAPRLVESTTVEERAALIRRVGELHLERRQELARDHRARDGQADRAGPRRGRLRRGDLRVLRRPRVRVPRGRADPAARG